MENMAKQVAQTLLKQMKPKLESLKEKAEAELRQEIYWTVYRTYKPVLYGKRRLVDGTVESGRTWQLLNSVTSSPLTIQSDYTITFTVYLDPTKMGHFSGRNPAKKVYIGFMINDGHKHRRLRKPKMYNTYPARRFIESAIKNINALLRSELKNTLIISVKRLDFNKSR